MKTDTLSRRQALAGLSTALVAPALPAIALAPGRPAIAFAELSLAPMFPSFEAALGEWKRQFALAACGVPQALADYPRAAAGVFDAAARDIVDNVIKRHCGALLAEIEAQL